MGSLARFGDAKKKITLHAPVVILLGRSVLARLLRQQPLTEELCCGAYVPEGRNLFR